MDVSIIVTAFNYERYITECIESCLNQKTNFDYEIIIVDDGSMDNTREIASKYSKYCRLFFIENSGVEAASNFGIRRSNAPYFIRLDADDSLKTNILEILLTSIKTSNAKFAYANYNHIDENSLVIKEFKLPAFNIDEIFSRGDFLASGTIVCKKMFFELGCYNEQYKNCGLENYEFILKALRKGFQGALVDENLFNYRVHSSNLSLKRRDSLIEYGQNLFKREGYGEFTTNEFHPYGLTL